MNCMNYVLRAGDNLYQIAQHYNTTVNKILYDNPGIDPYRLHIGDTIKVCLDSPVDMNGQSHGSKPFYDLSNAMRMAWEQHVYWTRMLIIGIVDGLNDVDETTQRILKNPVDIANIFRPFYGDQAANTIESLLTHHLAIGKDLITYTKNGNTTAANDANTRWYANADQIANALSSINPYYNRENAREMMYSHLDLTKHEVSARMSADHLADIAVFDDIEQQAVDMADALTNGILQQFPSKF